MSAQVDWGFARTVAERVSGQDAFGTSYHRGSLEADLLELTAQAERLVEAETGLVSLAGPARARVTDRLGWVDANLASFERLMRPLLGRLDGNKGDDPSSGTPGDDPMAAPTDADGPSTDSNTAGTGRNGTSGARSTDPTDSDDPTAMPDGVGDPSRGPGDGGESASGEGASGQAGPFISIGRALSTIGGSVGPKVAGAQVGALLGWMSSRVLGQYDLLITEDDSSDDQDWVYFVGPNVLALEKRYGFPPQEFRLWIAVHECTHRAQFTGVPWLRGYFLSLVDELLDSVDPDPGRVLEALQATLKEARDGNRPNMKDGGLSMLLATPAQKETMKKVSGLMSLLEGHGDIIMDRATRDLIPSQQRFARVMSQRRNNATGLARLIQRLTGMEAKMAQYEEGEEFVRAVEAEGGRELFDLVWTGPEALPTIDEIRQPELWIERVRSGAGA